MLAIIPARAGSRGVPEKNIRPLAGKPVIEYSIQAALAAGRVDRVAVSTDEERIRPICARYPQVVYLERPAEMASDTARIDDALRHAVRQMRKRHDYHPNTVALLYANVPVRGAGVIDRAIAKLEETGADSVQSFSPVGKFHPYWLYRLEGDRAAKFIDNQIYRRQELPPVYAVDGAVAVVRTEVLLAAEGSPDPHAFWGRDRRGIIQDPGETVDIDTLRDFFLAEAMLKSKHDKVAEER